MQRRRVLAVLGATGLGLVHPVALAAFRSKGRSVTIRPAPLPPGYAAMARRFDVPPLILYGIALQESALLFG